MRSPRASRTRVPARASSQLYRLRRAGLQRWNNHKGISCLSSSFAPKPPLRRHTGYSLVVVCYTAACAPADIGFIWSPNRKTNRYQQGRLHRAYGAAAKLTSCHTHHDVSGCCGLSSLANLPSLPFSAALRALPFTSTSACVGSTVQPFLLLTQPRERASQRSVSCTHTIRKPTLRVGVLYGVEVGAGCLENASHLRSCL